MTFCNLCDIVCNAERAVQLRAVFTLLHAEQASWRSQLCCVYVQTLCIQISGETKKIGGYFTAQEILGQVLYPKPLCSQEGHTLSYWFPPLHRQSVCMYLLLSKCGVLYYHCLLTPVSCAKHCMSNLLLLLLCYCVYTVLSVSMFRQATA